MEEIFGRDLELTAMEQFLNSTLNWPSAVVIEGEAGIGKTTLWLEARPARRGTGHASSPGAARSERAEAVLCCARGSGRRGVR